MIISAKTVVSYQRHRAESPSGPLMGSPMVHGSICRGAADLDGISCLHPGVEAHQARDVKGLSKKLKVAQHLRQQPQLPQPSVLGLDMTTSNDRRTTPLPLHDLNFKVMAFSVSSWLRAQSIARREDGACYV